MAISPPATDSLELLRKAFYSPSEVADLASVSSSTVLNYIHDGRLAAVKLSERTYRIPRRAVARMLGMTTAPVVREEPTGVVES